MPASTFAIRSSILATSALVARFGVEQGDMLVGQRLGLLLGEAAVGQALDEAVGIERDGL